jgi:hypothetical protein
MKQAVGQFFGLVNWYGQFFIHQKECEKLLNFDHPKKFHPDIFDSRDCDKFQETIKDTSLSSKES